MTGTVPSPANRRRVAVALILFGVVAAAVLFSSPLREMTDVNTLRETITDLRVQVHQTWWAPIAFIIAFVVCTTLFVPATVFVLTGAFFWGWVLGGTYSVIGAIVCAAISFELSRYVFGGLAHRLLKERLPWLHRLFDNAGARSVLFLRLVPGIPFPMFNFGAGLTSLRLRDYMAGSSVGLMIPIYIISFSADAIFAGTLERGAVAWRLAVAAALLALMVLIPPLIARRLRRTMDGPDAVAEAEPGAPVVH